MKYAEPEITSISVNNYKAFAALEVPLSTLTLLVGDNNAGKSSFLNVLLLLYQTVGSIESFGSPLMLNGMLTSMGEPDNLLYFKNRSKPITIKIDFNVDRPTGDIGYTLSQVSRLLKLIDAYVQPEEPTDKYIRYYIETLIPDLNRVVAYGPHAAQKETSHTIEAMHEKVNKLRELVRGIKKPANGDPKTLFDMKRRLVATLNVVEDVLTAAARFEEEFKGKLSVEYVLRYSIQARSFVIAQYTIKSENTDLLKYTARTRKTGTVLACDLFDPKVAKKIRTGFHNLFTNDGMLVSLKEDFEVETFGNDLIDLLRESGTGLYCMAIQSLLLNFANGTMHRCMREGAIIHVSPLRAYPRRLYMFDNVRRKSNPQSLIGDEIVDILRESPGLLSQLNDWLSSYDIQVVVRSINEIMHSVVIRSSDIDLDYSDIGFGFSQVIPVLISTLLIEPNRIIIIEQPEIHLHPKMHSELGSYLVKVARHARSVNAKLIIETHSESLINSIRAGLAIGELMIDDVSIAVFSKESDSKGNKVNLLKIKEKGGFEWPKEFYESDWENTRKYLEAQK